MDMIVHIYEGDQKGSIEWCKKNFDDIVEVKGPTIAALHIFPLGQRTFMISPGTNRHQIF